MSTPTNAPLSTASATLPVPMPAVRPAGDTAPAPRTPAVTGPTLLVTSGRLAGQQWRLRPGDPMVIGRHPDNDLVLADVSVSRRHAEIRSHADTFVLVDTGSLNGSYVNRQPIDVVALSHGDEIHIGTFRLMFLDAPGTGGSRRATPGG